MQFLKKHNFTECALGIRRVLESIKNFLQSDRLASLLLNGFPHNAVSLKGKFEIKTNGKREKKRRTDSFSEKLADLVLLKDMLVNFFAHFLSLFPLFFFVVCETVASVT
jgi:hypothetical protein